MKLKKGDVVTHNNQSVTLIGEPYRSFGGYDVVAVKHSNGSIERVKCSELHPIDEQERKDDGTDIRKSENRNIPTSKGNALDGIQHSK
jgi:hypothetical protein